MTEKTQKEIKINIPEGYEIDKENSTFECIKFRKIEKKLPMSWKEYVEEVRGKCSYLSMTDGHVELYLDKAHYDAFKTPEEANAFIALGKLIQLRDIWVGDWKAKWNNKQQIKYCIDIFDEDIVTFISAYDPHILAFPTEEMRDKFLETFRNLIEQAKMFI